VIYFSEAGFVLIIQDLMVFQSDVT